MEHFICDQGSERLDQCRSSQGSCTGPASLLLLPNRWALIAIFLLERISLRVSRVFLWQCRFSRLFSIEVHCRWVKCPFDIQGDYQGMLVAEFIL
ncbi:hypothetical protein AVEN_115786-1 [Araneus ventricosus]|uniref:Uncharacterized protein n=1 Tax=Araneus ventricosus TaxID=182803 RepID=A0A4Y2MQM0_ARAVE|nr:hypothetical protein AVEN_115786-1 [Araneus ventricosus]